MCTARRGAVNTHVRAGDCQSGMWESGAAAHLLFATRDRAAAVRRGGAAPLRGAAWRARRTLHGRAAVRTW